MRGRAHSLAFSVALCFAAHGCHVTGPADGGTPDGAVPTARLVAIPACANPNEAPIRTGDGTHRCTLLGAAETEPRGEWPDIAGLAQPVVYVHAAAAAGGDGTQARPFQFIREALASMPAAASIVLSSGTHTLAAVAQIAAGRSLLIRGTGGGVRGSLVALPTEGVGFAVTGAGAQLTLEHLAIRETPGGVPADVGAAVQVSMGAEVTLRDLVIDGTLNGVDVTASTLTLDSATLRNARVTSVLASMGATLSIRNTLVLSSARYGIIARDSRVDIADSAVMRSGRDGIALIGTASGRSTMRGVTSMNNGVTGIRLEGRLGADLSRVISAGTRIPDGTIGGDGIYVGMGANANIGVAGAASTMGADSLVARNDRIGISVAGDTTSVSIEGTTLGSNEGPGLWAYERARVATVTQSDAIDNGGAGMAFSFGAQVELVSLNRMRNTRMARAVRSCETGDGLSLTESGTTSTFIDRNVVEQNARFAIVLDGVGARVGTNRGSGNANSIYVGSTSTVTFDTPTAPDALGPRNGGAVVCSIRGGPM